MKAKLRILIIDDDRRMARTLMDIFNLKGYKAEAANSGTEALEMVKNYDYDCVLSDIKMPDINGVELMRAIKEIHPDMPVVLMTAYASEGLIEEGFEKGAIATLTKPLDINLLLFFFSSLRKERSIVIVDDDPDFCETLADILHTRGFKTTEITDPEGIIEKLSPEGQIVLLDMKLGDKNGVEVLKEIREVFTNLPVIMVTAYRNEMSDKIKLALNIGAYTCLYKPLGLDELFRVLDEIRKDELSKTLNQSKNKLL